MMQLMQMRVLKVPVTCDSWEIMSFRMAGILEKVGKDMERQAQPYPKLRSAVFYYTCRANMKTTNGSCFEMVAILG